MVATLLSAGTSAPVRAASMRCCPAARSALGATPRSFTANIQLRSSTVPQQRQRQRSSHLVAAAKAKAKQAPPAEDAEEAGAEEQESPVEETSDVSPFADLIQQARDAIASGSQEDQDQVLAQIDTELTVSSAKAGAADAQLAAAQGEIDAAKDKFLRINAEFDNFRKRSTKEKTDAVNKAKANVIEDLLPVIDAFESAAGQVKAETEGEQRIASSYQGLYAKLVDAFKKMGLEVVPGIGSPFNPEVHEAIMRAPSDEYPDGTVLQEFRRGFTIGSQLLRPAMVQVSYSEDGVAADADVIAQKAASPAAGDVILEDSPEE